MTDPQPTRKAVRLEVIKAYGGKCACCGESQFEFLAIDHVNNDGSVHRKVVKFYSLIYWLRKNNFPTGFQILCHNCNMAKGIYGGCPHEVRATSLVA